MKVAKREPSTAYQITETNMDMIAVWSNSREVGDVVIATDVSPDDAAVAHVGDWVVVDDEHHTRFYTPLLFELLHKEVPYGMEKE